MNNFKFIKEAISNLKVNEPLKVPGQKDFKESVSAPELENSEMNPRGGVKSTRGYSAPGLKLPGGELTPPPSQPASARKPMSSMDLLEASRLVNYEQFAPKGCVVEISKPEKEGVFQIPHRLLEWVHRCIDSKNERAVFLCLLRYSLGFWKADVVASRSYVSKWTGLDGANIRKAFKALREQGLIVLIQESGPEQTAIYKIPVVQELFSKADHLEGLKQETKGGGNLTPGQNTPGSNQPLQGSEIAPSPGVDSPPNKENVLNKTINKTLSLPELTESLKAYFAVLLPRTKREQEMRDFLSLLKDYSVSDISDAFDWISKRGTLGKGEKVYSPMAYLAVSIVQVLAQVSESRRSEISKAPASKAAEQGRRVAQQEAELLDQQFEAQEAAFAAAFPTGAQRENYFANFKKLTNSKYESSLLKSMAILHWSKQNSQTFGGSNVVERRSHG